MVKLELKIIGGVIGLFLIYIVVLYVVNRAKAKKLINTIMIEIEILTKSNLFKTKKEYLYSEFSVLIDKYLVKFPLAKTLLKWFIRYEMDKFIESNVSTMNETIAPVVKSTVKSAINTGIELGVNKLTEKITSTEQPSTNETVVDLAKVVLENEAKGVVSIFG